MAFWALYKYLSRRKEYGIPGGPEVLWTRGKGGTDEARQGVSIARSARGLQLPLPRELPGHHRRALPGLPVLRRGHVLRRSRDRPEAVPSPRRADRGGDDHLRPRRRVRHPRQLAAKQGWGLTCVTMSHERSPVVLLMCISTDELKRAKTILEKVICYN